MQVLQMVFFTQGHPNGYSWDETSKYILITLTTLTVFLRNCILELQVQYKLSSVFCNCDIVKIMFLSPDSIPAVFT